LTEAWAVGGKRNSDGIDLDFVQTSLGEDQTRENSPWDFTYDRLVTTNSWKGNPLTHWALDYAKTMTNESGDGRTLIQGIDACANRPFESEDASFSIKNGEMYGLWAGVWIVDTSDPLKAIPVANASAE